MYKVRDNIYWNDNSGPISVIKLSTTSGAALNAVWNQRKYMWYVVEPESEKIVIQDKQHQRHIIGIMSSHASDGQPTGEILII